MVKKTLGICVYIIKENEELLKTRATCGRIWAIGAKQNFLQKKFALFSIVLKSREYLSQKLTGSNKKSSGNS